MGRGCMMSECGDWNVGFGFLQVVLIAFGFFISGWLAFCGFIFGPWDYSPYFFDACITNTYFLELAGLYIADAQAVDAMRGE